MFALEESIVVPTMATTNSQIAISTAPQIRRGRRPIVSIERIPTGVETTLTVLISQVLCRWGALTLTNRYDQRDGESVVDASLLEECGAEIEEVDAGCGKISQYGFLLTIAQTKMKILDCFQMEKEYIRLTQLLNHLHCHSEKANGSGCFL